MKADRDDTFFGWQIVALGDQNGDGFSDIIVTDILGRAYLYYGGNPPSSTPVAIFHNVLNRISNIGDINTDAIADYAIKGTLSSDTQLSLFLGGASVDTVPDGGLGTAATNPEGYAVNGKDLNSTGTSEIISWGGDHRSLVLFELTALSRSAPDRIFHLPVPTDSPAYDMGDGLIATDLNGDGFQDIITNLKPHVQYHKNGSVLIYRGGPGFDTIPDMRIVRRDSYQPNLEQFGTVLVSLGDFNHDTYNDFLASSGTGAGSADSLAFIYFGGPTMDTIPDIILADGSEFAAPAGDVNHDGYPDLLTSFPLESSVFGFVNVYFGGPAADSIIDIHINVNDLPMSVVQENWGMNIAGIGDFNGDGIDDFAASGEKPIDTGVVIIFAGVGPSTDVKPRPNRSLPSTFALGQNYPNPFNPSTTIAFELPHRTMVKLDILNVLGQRVRKLLNKTLSVGSYQIEWDGRNDYGKPVPSGTYFYRLTADDFSETKKMVLVK